jgi:hypothetical protein
MAQDTASEKGYWRTGQWWSDTKSLLRSIPRLLALLVLLMLALLLGSELSRSARFGIESFNAPALVTAESIINSLPGAQTNIAQNSEPIRVRSRRPTVLPFAVSLVVLLTGTGISVYGVIALTRNE